MKPEREWELRVVRYAATETVKEGLSAAAWLAGSLVASAVAFFPGVTRSRGESVNDSSSEAQDLGSLVVPRLTLVVSDGSQSPSGHEDFAAQGQ